MLLLVLLTVLGSTQCTVVSHVYFDHQHVTSGVDISIVAATFARTSFMKCAATCSGSSSLRSLYFDEAAGQCYCNNQIDGSVVWANSTDGLIYAYVAQVHGTGPPSGQQSVSTTQQPGSTQLAGSSQASPTAQQPSSTTAPGEWVIFQRRLNGSENFNRTWADYVNGFGYPAGEFWLGLEAIHQGTITQNCQLSIYLQAEIGNPTQYDGVANYDTFHVDPASANYSIRVFDFSGTVADSFSDHSTSQFSTYDNDHDGGDPRNCALEFGGGWWFHNCQSSNLNGPYLDIPGNAGLMEGITWVETWGYFYSLSKTEMKFRCP